MIAIYTKIAKMNKAFFGEFTVLDGGIGIFFLGLLKEILRSSERLVFRRTFSLKDFTFVYWSLLIPRGTTLQE